MWNGTDWRVKREGTLNGICDNRLGEFILPFSKCKIKVKFAECLQSARESKWRWDNTGE